MLLTLKAALKSTTGGGNEKPCDQFDLITGVGSGGLVALLLGRLRLGLDDAIDIYKSIASECFLGKFRVNKSVVRTTGGGSLGKKSRWSKLFLGNGGGGEGLLDGRDGVFESILGRYLPEEAMHQLDLSSYGSHSSKAKTAILGFRLPVAKEGSRINWFRSYSYDQDQSQSLTIKDVARATMASSGFFKPFSPPISSSSSSHSKIIFGEPQKKSLNPSEATLEEAKRIYGDAIGIACFLSVGVGRVAGSSAQGGKSKTRTKSLKAVVKIIEDAEGESARFRARATREGWQVRYFFSLI